MNSWPVLWNPIDLSDVRNTPDILSTFHFLNISVAIVITEILLWISKVIHYFYFVLGAYSFQLQIGHTFRYLYKLDVTAPLTRLLLSYLSSGEEKTKMKSFFQIDGSHSSFLAFFLDSSASLINLESIETVVSIIT